MTATLKKTFSFLCVILLLLGFYMLRRNYGILPSFTEHRFTVSGSEGVSWSRDFSDIAAIELLDQWDAGEVISGGSKYGFVFGTRRNTSAGEYTLLTLGKINDCFLKVTDQDGSVLVLNYESKDSTVSLFSMLRQLFENEGIPAVFSDTSGMNP